MEIIVQITMSKKFLLTKLINGYGNCVTLNGCHMVEPFLKVLFKELSFRTKVTNLRVHGNCNSYDIGLFCKYLKNNKSITHLNLGDNHINDKGCEILCETLPTTGVCELVLDGNLISDTGCVAISGALVKSNIKRLWMCDNPITNKGFKVLLETIYETKLRYLSLFGAGIRESIQTTIHAALAKNKKRLDTQDALFVFLMGSHYKYGIESSVFRLFNHYIFERQLIPLIYEFMYDNTEYTKLIKELDQL